MLRIEFKNGYIQQAANCWQVFDLSGSCYAEVDSFESAYQHYLAKQPEKDKVRNSAMIVLTFNQKGI